MLCTNCSEEIRPVVALDIDGTLADYYGSFLEYASRYLNRAVDMGYDGSRSLATWIGISKEEYRQVKLAYRQGGMKRLMPAIDGAVGLATKLHELGVEVWITTTRPYLKHDSTDPDTRDWLSRHGIDYYGLLYHEQKYRELLTIVDKDRVVCVLDDLAVNVSAAQDLGLHAIQIRTPFNAACRRCPGVANLYDAQLRIEQLVNEWKERHA